MASGPSTTSTSGIPQWLQDAGKSTYDKGLSLYNAPFVAPPSADQRVAGFSPDQTSAFGLLRDMVNSGGGAYGDLFTQGTNLIANPGSGLSPYVDATLAPTIRNINEAATAQRGQVGDQATGAGAYGDARHGVLEGQVNRNADLAIGDATGKAYADAYNAAAARGGALVGAAGQGQGDFLSRIQAMLGTGQQQQQQAQSKADVGFQNYQLEQQSPYDKLAALLSSFTGSPYNRTTTSSSSSGVSPLFSLLGSLLGAG